MSLHFESSDVDILNVFRDRWFLSRDFLISLVASAQRTTGGPIDWVELTPTGRAHLVHSAIVLAHPIPVAKVEQVMFVYILEILNKDGPMTNFFAHCSPQSLLAGVAIDELAIDDLPATPTRHPEAQASISLPPSPLTPIGPAAPSQEAAEKKSTPLPKPQEDDSKEEDVESILRPPARPHSPKSPAAQLRALLDASETSPSPISASTTPGTQPGQPTRKSNRKPKPTRPFEA